MAVLGFQLVLTLIVASFLSKAASVFSPAQQLIVKFGLYRYLSPSDDKLKKLIGYKEKSKDKSRPNSNTQLEFNVTKNALADLDIAKLPLQTLEIVQLKYYTEFQWVVDFSFFSLLIYNITELCIYFGLSWTKKEMNLSLIWCVLAMSFSYFILASLTALYFTEKNVNSSDNISKNDTIKKCIKKKCQATDGSGEYSVVIVMFFAYLLIAMLVLFFDNHFLDTNLHDSYRKFSLSMSQFLHNIDRSQLISELFIKFCIALWCATIGAILTFPGLRFARIHLDALKDCSWFLRTLLHMSFVCPLFVSVMWFKPLVRDILTNDVYQDKIRLTDHQFELLRVYAVYIALFMRFILFWKYIQTYLDVAKTKYKNLLHCGGSYVTNLQIQRSITHVFYYLIIVVIQLVAPIVLILNLTLIYKHVIRESFTTTPPSRFVSPKVRYPVFEIPVVLTPHQHLSQGGGHNHLHKETSASSLFYDFIQNQEPLVDTLLVKSMAGQFSHTWLSLKQIVSSDILMSIFGFSVWWCCFAWFLSSTFGIIYHFQFSEYHTDR